jgi:hypothetical protein
LTEVRVCVYGVSVLALAVPSSAEVCKLEIAAKSALYVLGPTINAPFSEIMQYYLLGFDKKNEKIILP